MLLINTTEIARFLSIPKNIRIPNIPLSTKPRPDGVIGTIIMALAIEIINNIKNTGSFNPNALIIR